MILTYLPPRSKPVQDQSSENVVNHGIRIVKRFSGELYQEGERLNDLFLLIEGEISLFKRNECGRSVRLPSIRSGAVLGVEALEGTPISKHSAKVTQAVRLLAIPFDRLPEFMSRWPKLKEHITLQLINRIDILEGT